jgi:hypothetical protein
LSISAGKSSSNTLTAAASDGDAQNKIKLRNAPTRKIGRFIRYGPCSYVSSISFLRACLMRRAANPLAAILAITLENHHRPRPPQCDIRQFDQSINDKPQPFTLMVALERSKILLGDGPRIRERGHWVFKSEQLVYGQHHGRAFAPFEAPRNRQISALLLVA